MFWERPEWLLGVTCRGRGCAGVEGSRQHPASGTNTNRGERLVQHFPSPTGSAARVCATGRKVGGGSPEGSEGGVPSLSADSWTNPELLRGGRSGFDGKVGEGFGGFPGFRVIVSLPESGNV